MHWIIFTIEELLQVFWQQFIICFAHYSDVGVRGDLDISRLETMAMTEKQQQKLQFCENNWVKRKAGVKRIDKRRMEEMRKEVGGRESLTRKLVRTRLKWAGYVEGMEGVQFSKRADALKVEGRGRRERPRLR